MLPPGGRSRPRPRQSLAAGLEDQLLRRRCGMREGSCCCARRALRLQLQATARTLPKQLIFSMSSRQHVKESDTTVGAPNLYGSVPCVDVPPLGSAAMRSLVADSCVACACAICPSVFLVFRFCSSEVSVSKNVRRNPELRSGLPGRPEGRPSPRQRGSRFRGGQDREQLWPRVPRELARSVPPSTQRDTFGEKPLRELSGHIPSDSLFDTSHVEDSGVCDSLRCRPLDSRHALAIREADGAR